MMSKVRKGPALTMVFAALVLAGLTGCASQPGGPLDSGAKPSHPEIAERNELMERNALNMRTIKASSSRNRQQAATASQELAADAKRLRALFPEGSGSGSKASNAIWTNRAGFAAQLDSYESAAVRLADAIRRNDGRGIADGITSVEQQCSSCHKQYRSLF